MVTYLAIIKGTFYSQIVYICIKDGGHLSLLYRAHFSLWM